MPVASNPVFPTSLAGLGFPVIRTPIWATMDQVSIAGVNVPNEPWTYPRYRWTLTFEFLRQAAAYGELQTLMGFFNQVGGKYGVFQYADPQDGTVSTGQTIGTGDSTTTAFQLVRARGSFVEPVFAVSTMTNVSVGSTIISSTQYTVSNKGLLTVSTFAPPAGQAVQWNGTYNWFCRFDKDDYDFEQFTGSSNQGGPLWLAKSISFTSIKFGA
jgi:uncharacterized protein (TIGR02217 family)